MNRITLLVLGVSAALVVGAPCAGAKIESSATLQGSWSPVTDHVPANAEGTTTSYDLGPTTSPDRNFFRALLKD